MKQYVILFYLKRFKLNKLTLKEWDYISFWLLGILIFSSCLAQKSQAEFGLLKGSTGEYRGNCMPAPGTPACKPKPISTLVVISELTKNFKPELVVDSIQSDEKGNFQLRVPKGVYSLFLKDEDQYVCTIISCPNECYCTPIKIAADSATVIELNLDHATW